MLADKGPILYLHTIYTCIHTLSIHTYVLHVMLDVRHVEVGREAHKVVPVDIGVFFRVSECGCDDISLEASPLILQRIKY